MHDTYEKLAEEAKQAEAAKEAEAAAAAAKRERSIMMENNDRE